MKTLVFPGILRSLFRRLSEPSSGEGPSTAEGTIRPNHKRTIPLASLLLRTVDGGLLTPELAEIYAGSLVSAFQLRRRLMSLLDRVYSEARGLPPRSIFRMSPTLRAELLVCAVLLPQSAIDFRTPGAPILVASDASSRSEAAVCLDVRREVSVECCRHGLQRGLWNRLLKPLGALQRERGSFRTKSNYRGLATSLTLCGKPAAGLSSLDLLGESSM